MSRDEAVDGPKIAAQILARMRASNKERIFANIEKKDPGIAAQIEAKLVNIEDLKSLSPKNVQKFLQKVDHRDLVVSLKTASQDLQSVLLKNMSERKRELVIEDLSHTPAVKIADAEDAQRRILEILENLDQEPKRKSNGFYA